MIKYLIFDTETTGLNIIKDKPFLFTYGLVDSKLNLYATYDFDVNDTYQQSVFEQHLRNVDTIIGHNIKFDIHMALNIGISIDEFRNKNYIDTSVLARLCIDHDLQTDATFSTALKKLAVKYLGIDSADEERQLKAELSRLTMLHKAGLKQYLIDNGGWIPNLTTVKETQLLNNIYSTWNKVYHLYPGMKALRAQYFLQHPAPTYKDVANVRTYARTDIRLTHGLFKLWYAKAIQLGQGDTLKRISRATIPLVLMERTGLTVDLQQILKDRNALLKEFNRTKIIDPRTNTELKIGQHAKLKELYEYESGLMLNKADKETRNEIEHLSQAAKSASYLAKMDKYLSTYITGILNKLVPDGNTVKVYTQYNLAGTVTGRLSSDFQQFPRDPLVLDTGYEVNIRSWFIVPKDHKYMFYFDYSQMELRLQCEWTNIINGQPDINLARAFSPYKCIQQGDKYFLEEDITKEWTPIDLHGLTAKNAFPGIDETHPDWKHYRSLGKRANFACNYGASAPKIQEALKLSYPEAKALVDGYKQTFKGVVDFSKWIGRRVYVTDSIPNLLLRRYYSRNKHLLLNWLVQGSGADILLQKLRDVYDYISDKPHWQLMISVHDEVGLICKDIPEAQLKQEVAMIRQTMCYQLSAVDIISDVEYTETKWSEKTDWKE